jgi:thiol:disulfide interchange protein DsbD
VLLSNAFGTNVAGDIFNAIGTHWIPNLIFFVIFMIFAASFLGAFEITLPSSLVNKSDEGADKGGLVGIFFMALTLVLVSFSCTGPIVGSVLIKSTQGEFWEPMVTMLAFSVAFALPFTVLAFSPSLLKKFRICFFICEKLFSNFFGFDFVILFHIYITFLGKISRVYEL